MATLTLRAEHALLGAMLADPVLIHSVRRYLDPDSFTTGRTRAVFAACDAARDQARPESPKAWLKTVRTGSGVSARYLRELEEACLDPAHGLSYGALVMQAVARRELAVAARQAARTSNDLRQNASRLVRADGVGGRRIADLARHSTGVADALRIHALVFDPDITQLPPGPGLAQRGRARDEERVLSALLQRHPQTERLLRLPLDDAFTTRARGEIFRAVKDLHVSARDIDELTVDWETARRASEDAPQRRTGTPKRSTEPGYAAQLAAASLPPGGVLETARSLLRQPARDRRPEVPAARRQGPALLQPPPGMTVSPGPVQRA